MYGSLCGSRTAKLYTYFYLHQESPVIFGFQIIQNLNDSHRLVQVVCPILEGIFNLNLSSYAT